MFQVSVTNIVYKIPHYNRILGETGSAFREVKLQTSKLTSKRAYLSTLAESNCTIQSLNSRILMD